MKPFMILAALAAAASPAFAQTVALKGLRGETATVTAADLAALPQVSVTVQQHGGSHVYEGPLLLEVLRAVGAPTGVLLRGPDLADVALVSAPDGYHVALDLAGIDPTMRKDRVILAVREDGAPLDAKSGPFRLVIEGDLWPARAERMVSAVRIARVGP